MLVLILDGLELEAGVRSLSIVFMCRIKFYVFVCLVHSSGNKVWVYLFGIIYNQNIIHITYVEHYFLVLRRCFICLSSKYCRLFCV